MSGWKVCLLYIHVISLPPQLQVRGVVMVECGGVQGESFPALQEVASVELGLETIPVSSPDQAARYLAQMVS